MHKGKGGAGVTGKNFVRIMETEETLTNKGQDEFCGICRLWTPWWGEKNTW